MRHMSDIPTGVHLDDDGTARFVLDSQVITIKRPNLDEFATLADMANRIDYQVVRDGYELKALNERIRTSATASDKDIDKAVDLSRRIQNAKGGIVLKVLETLGDSKVDEKTLPPWVVGGAAAIMGRLFNHWETVPFHGSEPNER